MESEEKQVDFSMCLNCVHMSKAEHEEPCDDCLNNFTNTDSHKPIYFKPKE